MEPNAHAAVAARLTEARNELVALRARVVSAAQDTPRGNADGWEGIAAIAYGISLHLLFRDLEIAEQLLRSATDLTTAALYEMGAGA
jgi:hypothetical protein